jgi:hypothetical protein
MRNPKDFGEVQKKASQESDYKGKKGYWNKGSREDGTYQWGYKFKPNDNGKPTKEFNEVLEMQKPFIEADEARVHSVPKPKVLLRDRDGGVRYIDPARADATAKKHGWSHVWRAGGIPVERGADGMLFRKLHDGWDPTGRYTVGIFGEEVPHDTTQRDPDGNVWTHTGEGWMLNG